MAGECRQRDRQRADACALRLGTMLVDAIRRFARGCIDALERYATGKRGFYRLWHPV